jgi:thiosulfate/3-mercaptopyruvate sulfurtransferase
MNRIFLWRKFSLLVGFALAATLLLGGCGTDSYDSPKSVTNAPIAGAATNVLVEADTLKEWMDQGLVNAENSFNGKVVILDFASADASKRIPGACRVGAAELNATRLEGLAESGSMVATGAMIDAVIQRLGIDENTTIVLTTTGGTNMYQATRAYFIFRYWGFPQERLKVLNGGNTAWAAAVTANEWAEQYALTDVVPSPAPSAYSVRHIGQLRDDLRYSIGEMITEVVPALQAGTMLHLDALGPAHANGTSPTSSLNQTGKFAVLEGRIRGSKPLGQATLFDAADSYRFKSVEGAGGIRELFQNAGWEQDLPTVTACRAGVSCTVLFFAIEALLDSPAYVYDGSWGQWGLYSNSTENGGKIPTTLDGVRAKWAVDQYTISGGLIDGFPLTEAPRYNAQAFETSPAKALTDIESVTLRSDVLYGTNGPADPRANQVENADREYITAPPAGGAPGPNSGGAGGGC